MRHASGTVRDLHEASGVAHEWLGGYALTQVCHYERRVSRFEQEQM